MFPICLFFLIFHIYVLGMFLLNFDNNNVQISFNNEDQCWRGGDGIQAFLEGAEAGKIP